MTQVKWTKQAILAGTLAVLGMTTYWLEFKHRPEVENQEEQSKKVFHLKDVKVDTVTINDGSGHTYGIHCSNQSAKLCQPGENSKWEITSPLKLKADDSNANALISALDNLSITDTIDLKGETPEKRASLLKEYGLDPQTRSQSSTKRIEVDTPKGTTVLYLGLTHPIGSGIFAVAENVPAGQKPTGKVDETKVYLVPTYFKSNFDHDLTYWRDKKLMTVAAHDIESFHLKGSKVNVSGTRKDGQWTLKTAKGEELPGDIENIDNVLTAATYLSAKSFVTDNQKDSKARAALRGTKPVVTLTLQQEKGTAKEAPAPITLTLYAKAGAKHGKSAPKTDKLYATVSNLDPLYELDTTARERLDKELKDFRLAKLVTSMERFTAKRLDFSGKALAGGELVLKNQDGKWVMEGSSSDVDGEKVQNFLDRISGNRIQEFVSKIPGGEASGWVFKLGDDKNPALRQIAFWKSSGKLYARDLLSKRKEAFVVDPAVGDELPTVHSYFLKTAAPAAKSATTTQPGMPTLPKPPAPASAMSSLSHPEPGKPLIPVPPHAKKK